jgi:hypothetical protein
VVGTGSLADGFYKGSEDIMIYIDDIRDELESLLSFTYVENEGRDSIRFDLRDQSFWISTNGAVENLDDFPKGFQTKVMKVVKKHTHSGAGAA